MKKVLYIIISVLMLAACSDDTFFEQNTLTSEQQALIGRAVNFNVSMAEKFTTRTSYRHEGEFNEQDQMVIYRQYWSKAKNDWDETSYRVYRFDTKYATGTNISLGTDWKVMVGKKGADWDKTLNDGKGGFVPITQAAKDSLTWENGETLRFRAWSRSNLANALNNGTADRYYPDFCIADWVTVSGPTNGIPLVLRHVTTRIGFICKEGNEFAWAEICTAAADYQWEDNADSKDHDDADKFPTTTDDATMTAAQAAESVSAVYNRMCMPGGVNIDDGTLLGMTTTKYLELKTSNGFANIEQYATDMAVFGTKSLEQIKTDVERPVFNNIDGRMYMLSIPYDMSNDDETQGDILVLPPYTRFKIKLRDVNSGDAANVGYEAKEHIFSLSDIRNGDQPKYPNGLELMPGKSYQFSVGYQYDKLTVDVIEEGMDWEDGGKTNGNAAPNKVVETSVSKYGWWINAIHEAVKKTTEKGLDNKAQDYNPVFEISNLEELREFIALVNGDAISSVVTTKPLERRYREDENGNYMDNPDADELDSDDDKKKWWYRPSDDTWMTRAQAAQEGYIIYRQYYPQVSDQSARSEEMCLNHAYDFYDEHVRLHLVVQLKADIDMADISLPAIGKETARPFKGFFDGGGYTLSNVNMQEGYLFGFLEDGEIRDLYITSTHPTGLLNEGRTSSDRQNVRIVGISMKADSPEGSPIANKLLSTTAPENRGNAYVVGCIHEGNAKGALVGEGCNLYMYGCMYTANNRGGATLLGCRKDGWKFTAQPTAKTPSWGNFMCNYYIKEPLGDTKDNKAVGVLDNGSVKPEDDNYHVLQYIRGTNSHVMKAKVDNLLGNDVNYSKLSDKMKEEYYGIAPWKAMNYAIWMYNESVKSLHEYQTIPENHKCLLHYNVSDTGYKHLYPQLINGELSSDGLLDPLKQNN